MNEDKNWLAEQENCLTAQTIMVPCPIVTLEQAASLLNQEDWQSLRWLHLREGKSIRWISKHFGISRKTVGKYLKEPDAPRYQLNQTRLRPIIGPWREQIERIIEQDKTAPRKQRHTAKRIFERLVEDGYSGSDRSIRQLVAEIKNKPATTASVPLLFQPGKDAQVDFGESYVKIDGTC